MLIFVFDRPGVGTNFWVAAPSYEAAYEAALSHSGIERPTHRETMSAEKSMRNMLTRTEWIDHWVEE